MNFHLTDGVGVEFTTFQSELMSERALIHH